MSRILIISSGNPSRNPRPVKEAAALSAAGFHVTLLSGGNPALQSIDQATIAGINCSHVFVPDSRTFLTRFRRWLACRALRVSIESIHALGPLKTLYRQANSHPAELTIVHNEIPHQIGIRLMKQGRRVAADFEDWHSEDLLPADRRNRPLRLLRNHECFLLQHAGYCSTTSHALANALHLTYRGPIPKVITNSFSLQQTSNVTGLPNIPAFFWFSQTIGPGRGLENFLHAWASTHSPSRLVLLGEINPVFKSHLLSLLPPSFQERVDFLAPVSPAQLSAVIARHDIGLALEDRSIRNRDLTITNKILQYLNASLAVVASDTAGQREVLSHASNAGIIVATEHTTQYAASLDQLISNRSELANKKAAARQLAESIYCWEHEAPKLVNLVRETLAS